MPRLSGRLSEAVTDCCSLFASCNLATVSSPRAAKIIWLMACRSGSGSSNAAITLSRSNAAPTPVARRCSISARAEGHSGGRVMPLTKISNQIGEPRVGLVPLLLLVSGQRATGDQTVAVRFGSQIVEAHEPLREGWSS